MKIKVVNAGSLDLVKENDFEQSFLQNLKDKNGRSDTFFAKCYSHNKDGEVERISIIFNKGILADGLSVIGTCATCKYSLLIKSGGILCDKPDWPTKNLNFSSHFGCLAWRKEHAE